MPDDGLSFKEKLKEEIKDWLFFGLVIGFCAFAIHNDKKQAESKQIKKAIPAAYLNDTIKQHIR